MTNNQNQSSKQKISNVNKDNIGEVFKGAKNCDADLEKMIREYFSELNPRVEKLKVTLGIQDKNFKELRDHRELVHDMVKKMDTYKIKKFREQLQANEQQLRNGIQKLQGMLNQLDNKNGLENIVKQIKMPGIGGIVKKCLDLF
ncbi:hypothetical protein CAL7716_091050 [Calothrix sp. PCC 7716]|nr:hypothetical protein CAL7716_091050 [Calothrix sp. PCC 7716]